MRKDDEVIVSFEAKEDFKTLVVSNENVSNGTYSLYVDGQKVK